VLFIMLAACTKAVPGVCCTDAADCNEIGIDDVRSCSDGLVCIEHECSVPPPGACTTDLDCGAAAPHCASDGACVVCVESDQCSETAPVCDDVTHDCRGCAADEECASEVCDTANGKCALDSDVAYASPTGSDAAPCTRGERCSITHAFAVTTPTRRIVKLASGTYSAALTISDKSVRVLGTGATLSTPPSGLPPFSVKSNGTLEVLGLAIRHPFATSEAAIRCEGTATAVVLDQVTIDSDEFGFLGNPCSSVTIRNSRLHTRKFGLLENGSMDIERTRIDGVGIIVASGSSSSVRLTNSVVAINGGTDGPFGYSVFGAPLGTVFVSFSTVVTPTPVKCAASTAFCSGAPQGLCLDNSIIYNPSIGAPNNTVTGTGCQANYTLMFPQQTALPGANNKLGVDPKLLDAQNGDFHLAAGSPAIDAADPAAGNPTDFDGLARPQGSARDIGAYERAP